MKLHTAGFTQGVREKSIRSGETETVAYAGTVSEVIAVAVTEVLSAKESRKLAKKIAAEVLR